MCRGWSDACPIGMRTSQKGFTTNLVYKDFNMEKLLVGYNRTELVNWIDRRMKQSVILEMNLL